MVTMFRSITLTLMFWPLLCSGLEIGYGASMVNFPFVAAIYYKRGSQHNNRPFCTGTIILDNFVLTTCGCMHRQTPDDYRKRFFVYPSLLQVWVGSSFDYSRFDFAVTSSLTEAQMVQVTNVYMPGARDLKPILDPNGNTVLYNNYTANGYDYFWVDFALLKTESINYNNYVHAVPFDPHSMTESFHYWEKQLNLTEDFDILTPDCFIAGWGASADGPDAGKMYKLRYVKVRHTEMYHCTISYCGNCSLCRLRDFNETHYVCYSMYLGGDTCIEDEGAPLYCPWFGARNKNNFGWGALLGLLSGRMGNCKKAQLPSLFSLIWIAYPFITRVTGVFWPPPSNEWILPLEDSNDDYELELI